LKKTWLSAKKTSKELSNEKNILEKGMALLNYEIDRLLKDYHLIRKTKKK
jgi:hypothetical protein